MQRQGKIVAVFAIALVVLFGALVLQTGMFGKKRAQGSFLPKEEAALRYPYQQLTEREQQLYTALYEGVSACQRTISLPDSYTADEYEKVYLLMTMQEPQFFYVSKVYQLADVMHETEIEYLMTGAELTACQAMLESAAVRLTSSLDDSMSDAEKLAEIHDAIARNCSYESGDNTSNAYGCLCEGSALCEGYAKAFCYLARKAGCDVMCVTGTTDEGEKHVWNIAEIDGAYYNIDVTWDDNAAFRDVVSHRCFAIPDRRFEGHVPDRQGFIPPNCTEDVANVYHQNGMILNEATLIGDYCGRWAEQAVANGYMEFYCLTKEVYRAVTEDMENGGEVAEAISPYCESSYFRYIPDDYEQIVMILFD